MNKRKNIVAMLIIILACLIVMAGVLVSLMFDVAKEVTENPLAAFEAQAPKPTNVLSSTTASGATVEAVSCDVEMDGNLYNKQTGYVNIVLYGFDDMQDREDDGGNTDSIMVFKVGLETGEIAAISIPRDTWTLVNEYDKSGNLEYTYHTKINAAYSAAARKSDRYDNALDTIENLFEIDSQIDLDFDYYCSIDIKDMPSLCDAVGGVKVKLNYSVPYVGEKGETVTLTSETAQYYLRDRSTGQGDITRAQRHQTFMLALVRRIQEMGGKKAALALYDDVLKYITTNLSAVQITALASLADDINVDNIALYVLPGEVGGASYERPGSHYGDYRSVYIVDESALTNLVLDLYYDMIQ